MIIMLSEAGVGGLGGEEGTGRTLTHSMTGFCFPVPAFNSLVWKPFIDLSSSS